MEKKNFEKEFNYVDSGNISHSVNITDKDFDLVQVDKSIHDTKFKSKPTTFFKDALKRFSKNKASVAGACILGTLLLLSIIVPLANPNVVDKDMSAQQFLPPKLFPTGTGFWDGTVSYENKVADPSKIGTSGVTKGKMLPGNFSSDAGSTNFNEAYILNISDAIEGKTDSPSLYGNGGTLLIKSDKLRNDDPQYVSEHIVKFYTPLKDFDFTKDNYTIDVDYASDFELEGYTNSKYTVTFEYAPEKDSDLNTKSIELVSATDKDSSFNLNDKLNESGLFLQEGYTSKIVKDAYVSINLLPSSDVATVLPITRVDFTNGDVLDDKLSIKDPCKKLSVKRAQSDEYWTLYSFGNGSKALKDATCYYVSFQYDAYGDLFGVTEQEISQTIINDYIADGKLPKDFNTHFKQKYENKDLAKLGYEDSPVVRAVRRKLAFIDDDGNNVYTYVCSVYKYKSEPFNYDSMPTFIFGTDQQGHDVLKIVFIGLRTSLLLGILASSVCFIFGLCYGAIEGYFGGTVDLVMQRFTDILSGVPWIVVMTLMILNFGQSFGVFAAALCLTGWIGVAGLTRTQFYRFRGREYILASRTLGANDGRLIFRHILPNSMGTIITSAVLMIPSVIFSEATISYLGLGLQGMDSLGVILSDNQKFLQDYPYLLVTPAVVIALLMISFNLFGNGLRDAFNPSLKGSE